MTWQSGTACCWTACTARWPRGYWSRLAGHPALAGPELTFLQARPAHLHGEDDQAHGPPAEDRVEARQVGHPASGSVEGLDVADGRLAEADGAGRLTCLGEHARLMA